jgi:hypothetical protein
MDVKGDRLCVEFSDSQSRELRRMACDLDTTKVGVLRLALSLMQFCKREREAGNRIAVVNNDRVVKEIVGLWAGE